MRALSVVRVLGLMGSVAALFSVGCGKADDDPDNGGESGAGANGGSSAATAGGGAGGATGGSSGSATTGGAGGSGGTAGSGVSGGTGGGGTSGTSAASGMGGMAGMAAPPLVLGIQPPPTGTFTDDRDGRTYRWVEIDGVRWMAENLRFKLGDQDVQTCNFNGTTQMEECEQYGYFYGWSAAHGQSYVTTLLDNELEVGTYGGVCPSGWHLASRAEWLALFDYVVAIAHTPARADTTGSFPIQGIAEPFRSTTEWRDNRGTNELGFDAKPYTEGLIGNSTTFWASDEYNRPMATTIDVNFKDMEVDLDYKDYRYAVRCIEGEPTKTFPKVEFPPPANTTGTFTDDRDGTAYATAEIGTQTWLAENLRFEPASGSYCLAEDDEMCRLFGRWYDYDVAQAACPDGWHLPTVTEWQTLASFVTTDAGTPAGTVDATNPNIAAYQLGSNLINTVIWLYAPATDPKYGFNALPGGCMADMSSCGTFGSDAEFWSAPSSDADTDQVNVTVDAGGVRMSPVREGIESSVRCVK